MSTRKTVLIVEVKHKVGRQLTPWLRKQGYHAIRIERPGTILPLLDSNDRIYSMVLVDDFPLEGSLLENLKILKHLGPKVPIVITTSENDSEKEKQIRKSGIFYYHLKNEGTDDLKDAVSCALKEAVEDELFMPFVGKD